MEISVRLYESMKQYAPEGRHSFTIKLHDAATVDDALKKLYIPEKTEMVILVNGRRAAKEVPLKEASTLVLYPPISGG